MLGINPHPYIYLRDIMAIELKYPNSPIDGYIQLDNLILPPETFAALRQLAISKCQSPDGMARLLIEQAVFPPKRGIELLDGLPRRRAVVDDDEDLSPVPRRARRAVSED
jgi:hypothetical protein